MTEPASAKPSAIIAATDQPENKADSSGQTSSSDLPPTPRDIFRDTWVRYFGYANEVGEAFR